jgi:histidinol-phosphate aminotransferase
MAMTSRVHGGPDAAGPVRWDFSTCANAAGPCPPALAAVRAADPTRYPDPQAHALREALAALHGVAPSRVLLAASASEFIQRVTAVGARLLPGTVVVPRHSYGDYAAAASAWQRPCSVDDQAPTLRWLADPSSPQGRATPPPVDPGAVPTVLDAVYAPLRLAGQSPWTDAARDAVFVLHSPNKALGLCGVRGAYAVAPRDAGYDVRAWCEALEAASPSWPLSAHAEAMLHAWATPAARDWVAHSHATLAHWKQALIEALAARGFELQPSITPFLCVRPPRPVRAARLRARDVAVRDASSFGLHGWWRVSAQPPDALRALLAALDDLPCPLA